MKERKMLTRKLKVIKNKQTNSEYTLNIYF